MSKILLATLALTSSVMAIPASAGETKVTYGDLNLTSIEGQEILEQRIDQAARKVCGYGDLTTGTRAPTPSMRSCYVKARNSARDRMAAIVEEKRLGG